MNQKHVVIIFFILIVLGLAVTGASSLKGTFATDVTTPTPTKKPIFNFNSKTQNTPQKNIPDNLQPTMTIKPTPVVKQYRQFPGILASDELKNKKAVIETDKGTISFEIYPEATKSASNFIFLAKDGFYDGLKFHRVEPGFVIQGGDPIGNGSGGPGYSFKEDKIIGEYNKGIVAMAKTANEPAGTGGSQFFIMLEDNPLPSDYAIFGKVIEGQDVVEKIQVGDIMKKVTISPL